ncbi:polyprenyl synthetase family protein [Bacillus pumilus]|uniref:polyprenyl synthetase family protein n=1 Tax=Bacillus sp. FSL K6-3149 TaxID=2921488 RepID=UPI00017A69FF|nr:farnesyl diphosphate synthase [Bacillus pumilus]EDW21019.1 geranyltranstransferase (Farnesyl-diphosphate synthase)(FPP synthase) [Bacillus pumilus ATCC 7061]KMY21958.1 farnesyl-diphosphate synthase [Bacillus pumilus]MCI4616236.1 polyprenyl synthetase family protein [Bacillus pumilus]MCR4353660.1 polyprenyl synthetase family protein [Bacillus pumilus]MCY7504907.1 polyprenyl synthetase family protein [Bacillus pumilus]
MTSNLNEFLTTRKQTIEDYLFTYVQELTIPEDLKSSMLYSLKAGGKRLRPVLVLALLNAYGKNEEDGIPVGCAVEMIHTYSLIHDDLPCMDDDDLRRGKPTNHKVYGEATAVLAGDALLTESFRLITSQLSSSVSADKKLRIVDELVKSAGALGMVGGQFDDMEAEQKQVSLAELESIHARKTGKLLTFSVAAGAMLAGASDDDIEKLREFSYHIGIAFQIRDDILDLEGSEEKIGKRVGSDTANEKSTYPSLLTLSGAKEKLHEHITRAKEIVSNLQLEQQLLHDLCDLIASRDH